MRALVAAALLAVSMAVPAASCASGTAAAPATELQISFWPEGREQGNVRRSTLRCGPAGGTIRNPGAACRRLAAVSTPFAPVPKEAVCTAIYGGPSVALVRGRYRGSRVWAQFRRTDGCNISRWNRVGFLLPPPLPASAGS